MPATVAITVRANKQVGVNKPYTEKSCFFKKPDFSTPGSFVNSQF